MNKIKLLLKNNKIIIRTQIVTINSKIYINYLNNNMINVVG
jgi:hypothetical protein